MSKANFIIITSFLLIVIVTLVAILIGRGYVPNFQNKSLQATGILVATSDPDGARVLVNDKLVTATNNTINLPPGAYDVKIAKDGYSTWSKKIEIKKEEVIKTNVFLFPQVAGLSPLTLTGAINPTPSLDEKRIVYGVASASAERNGIWILGTDSLRPLVGGSDIKLIYHNTSSISLSDSQYLWSPDNLSILMFPATKNIATDSANIYRSYINSKNNTPLISKAYLLDATKLNTSLALLSDGPLVDQLTSWSEVLDERNSLILSKIDPKVSDFFKNNTRNLSLSLDESKILYTATAAGTVPKLLTYYLPGTNPTPEVRDITPGNTYVFDLKEDKNYLIDNNFKIQNSNFKLTWFPSSRHLLVYTDKEIAVMDFDGTNKSVLYTGPFAKDLVVPWPNWSKIIILTSLNSLSGGTNLYTINLR